MRDSHIVYYDPPVAPADDMWGSVIVLLIIIAFIGGLIWLLSSTPAKPKADEKTLIQEIDGIFDELKTNAIMFKRDEAVPSLDRARAKVSEVLRKRGLATE